MCWLIQLVWQPFVKRLVWTAAFARRPINAPVWRVIGACAVKKVRLLTWIRLLKTSTLNNIIIQPCASQSADEEASASGRACASARKATAVLTARCDYGGRKSARAKSGCAPNTASGPLNKRIESIETTAIIIQTFFLFWFHDTKSFRDLQN